MNFYSGLIYEDVSFVEHKNLNLNVLTDCNFNILCVRLGVRVHNRFKDDNCYFANDCCEKKEKMYYIIC